MTTTFQNPEMFDYIGVMSMGFVDLSRFGIQVDLGERGKTNPGAESCQSQALLDCLRQGRLSV